jgi:hypothetical protein
MQTKKRDVYSEFIQTKISSLYTFHGVCEFENKEKFLCLIYESQKEYDDRVNESEGS